ncbi:MAG: glycosyltransferase [Terrestrivirus sp.]|uniref:Glycosyltransferase n=1 Tax=Terrestrivirus sp. TaxID=2487775 RepID=A0A3G4ZPA3_9VIRU|nr:MAG: glycosyltransferase [Terrestrivirus sp.]
MNINTCDAKIGIAITTLDRYDIFEQCITNMIKYKTSNMKIIVVDDFSSEGISQQNELLCLRKDIKYIKNTSRKGINKSKNICLEYLEDCDYIFLFDNDIWPVINKWHEPWIDVSNTTNIHLLDYGYDIYDDNGSIPNKLTIIGQISSVNNIKLASCSYPMGHMIFMTKYCLERIGGIDPSYKIYGAEHQGLSQRAFNYGLTRNYKYVTLPDHIHDFHSMDRLKINNIASSIEKSVKRQLIRINSSIYEDVDMNSMDYKLFKKTNCVITTYLTKRQGTLSHSGMSPNNELFIERWYEYILKHNLLGIILYDELDSSFIKNCTSKNVKFVKVEKNNCYPASNYKLIVLNEFITKYIEYLNNVIYMDFTDTIINEETNIFSYLFPNDKLILQKCSNRSHELKNQYNFISSDANICTDIVNIYDTKFIAGKANLIKEITREFSILTKEYGKIIASTDLLLFNHVIHQKKNDVTVTDSTRGHRIGIGIIITTNTIGTTNTIDTTNTNINNTINHFISNRPENSFVVILNTNPNEADKEIINKCVKNDIKYYKYPVTNTAQLKNKCIELLDHCDFIFLFDENIYPATHNWYKLYIESYYDTGIHHFYHHDLISSNSLNGSNIDSTNSRINNSDVEISNQISTKNFMMFITSQCVKKIGGMDIINQLYGQECSDFTDRIYDTINSHAKPGNYISLKYARQHFNVIPQNDIIEEKYNLRKYGGFRPYKKSDYILTTYLTTKDNKNCYSKENNNYSIIKNWFESITKINLNIIGIIFHDDLSNDFINLYQDTNIKFIKIDRNKYGSGYSANNYKFIIYDDFINIYEEYINGVIITELHTRITEEMITECNFNENKLYYYPTSSRIDIQKECNFIRQSIPGYNNYLNKSINSVLYTDRYFAGNITVIKKFIDKISKLIRLYGKVSTNINTEVFNFVIYTEMHNIDNMNNIDNVNNIDNMSVTIIKPRILLVTEYKTEKFAYNLISALENKYDQTLIIIGRYDKKLVNKYKSICDIYFTIKNVDFESYDIIIRTSNLLQIPFFTLKRNYKNYHNNCKNNCKYNKIRTVYIANELENPINKSQDSYIDDYLFTLSNNTLKYFPECEQQIKKMPDYHLMTNINVINNNNIKKELGIDADKKILLYVNNSLEPTKSMIFINLIKMISNEYVGLFVGDNIPNFIVSKNRIIFTKNQTDIVNYINICDYLIQLNKQEFFSPVIIKAAFMGKPFIMTKTGIANDFNDIELNTVPIDCTEQMIHDKIIMFDSNEDIKIRQINDVRNMIKANYNEKIFNNRWNKEITALLK